MADSEPLKLDQSSCFVDIPENCAWTLINIPFGVFKHERNDANHIATAIGNFVIDLNIFSDHYTGWTFDAQVLKQSTLNDFMSLDKSKWTEVRQVIQQQLMDSASFLGQHKEKVMFPMSECQMVLPCHIGDYTDFYSSIWHATNVGRLFRSEEEALKPNWLHLPVGYHGRASSVVVSGTNVHRPMGQKMPRGATAPVWGECGLLDFEVEVGAFFGGKPNEMGERITIDQAPNHIFGIVILNDWSARDIQKWEYVPLGPFNGKNFASTISPWIITMDALDNFKTDIIPQNQKGKVPLPYLRSDDLTSYDINLSVSLTTDKGTTAVLGETNTSNLYWTFTQQLTHHSSGGCPMKPGDLLGSGTISGQTTKSFGSMLELCSYSQDYKEKKAWAFPYTLEDGSTRKCIQDGDTITMQGYCKKGDLYLGFGDCTGLVLPPKPVAKI